ncbi:MAG: peptidoglycan-binding protein, partial [Actinomycetota bacterium]
MGRRSILALVAAVAVLAAGIGWVAGRQIKSPGQIAAEQEPPEPSLITVPVEFRTLSQNVIIRGTVRLSDQTPLSVGSAVGSSVITRLAKEAGDTIEEGDVVIEVAGRPVIALEGPLPAFRNLIPGLEGPDVEQLQQ